MPEEIYIVITPGLLHAAYRRPEQAGMHSRCILGATVVTCEILDDLPPEIREDLRTEFDSDEEQDTPVIQVDELDDKQ